MKLADGPAAALPPADADEPNDVAQGRADARDVDRASPTRSPTSATIAATSTRSPCAPARRCACAPRALPRWAATSGSTSRIYSPTARDLASQRDARAREQARPASDSSLRDPQRRRRRTASSSCRSPSRRGWGAYRLRWSLIPGSRTPGSSRRRAARRAGRRAGRARAGRRRRCAAARRAARSRPRRRTRPRRSRRPGSRMAAPPMRAPRRIDRALHERAPALGAAHEVVVRRDDAGRDEDVVLELAVGGDVGLGLDPHARADARVVLDRRAAPDDAVARRCVTRSRTTARSPTITRSPSVEPANTIAPRRDRAARADRRVPAADRAAPSTGRRARGACRARRCRRPPCRRRSSSRRARRRWRRTRRPSAIVDVVADVQVGAAGVGAQGHAGQL